MDRKKIDRINARARTPNTAEGLTAEEIRERDALRREYADAVVGDLRSQLEHTYIVDEQGNKRKLKGKGGPRS